MEETYQELKRRQQEEINNFPFIFAFNDKQLAEGMEKIGLTIKDTDKLLSLGSGSFIKKTDRDALNELFKKHTQEMNDAIKNDTNGEGFIFNMFQYELDNHEYCITYDTYDTLSSLGLTIEEVNNNPALKKGLHLALQKY